MSRDSGVVCALRDEIIQPPILVCIGHCTACQKITSSAFSAALIVTAEACCFTGGETRSFQRTADSGRRVTRRDVPRSLQHYPVIERAVLADAEAAAAGDRTTELHALSDADGQSVCF